MGLNLTKAMVDYDTTIGVGGAQTVCKAMVQLPQEMLDIRRLLAGKADARVDRASTAVADGVVSIEGKVILDVEYIAAYQSDEYVSDREPIRFYSGECGSFKVDIAVPEAKEGMKAVADAYVDSLELESTNGRTIAVTAIVKAAAKVTAPGKVEVISDITDYEAEQLRIDKKSLFLERTAGEGISSSAIREVFQIPDGRADIGDIIDFGASVSVNKDGSSVAGGRVTVKGTLELKIVYVGDLEEHPLVVLSGPQIDFQTSVDISGAAEGDKAKCKVYLTSISVTKVGSRMMQVEAMIDAAASVTGLVEVDAVTDIAAAGESIVDVRRSKLSLESLVGQVSTETTVTDSFAVGASKPDIDEILLTGAKGRVLEVRILPDKAVISGEVDVYVTYAGVPSEADELAQIDSIQQLGIPYETTVEISGIDTGMTTFATCEVLDVEAVKAGSRTIDMEINIVTSIKVTESVELDAVTDAAVVRPADVDAGLSRRITVYVVQHGDSLWDVARRYGKTMARIAEYNKVSGEEVYPGQKLLIPR